MLGNCRRFRNAWQVKQLERSDATVHYLTEGSGPPLVMVQGAGVVGGGWRPQIEALRHRHSIVALDNRGIGKSTFRGRTLTIDDMAGDVLAVADAEGFERFHLAGHSIGGLIAQAVALQARARVLSLALLCTFARGRDASRLAPDIVWIGMRTRLGTRAMRRRAFMQLTMPDAYLRTADQPRLAAELATLFGHDLADQPSIVMQQLRAAARFDVSSRLRELAGIRTLVMSARHDRIAPPRFGRALAAAIPGARYVEIDTAAHAAPIQCAGEVNALLAEHLAEAGNGRTGEPAN
jgi:aminoacrylate hydrolase